MPTDENNQDGHFFYNHPERGGYSEHGAAAGDIGLGGAQHVRRGVVRDEHALSAWP